MRGAETRRLFETAGSKEVLRFGKGARMKIAFIGGVKMGRDCLEEILSRGIRVEAIFCLPESESGRSGYANFDGLGKKYGIPLHKLADINSSEAVGLLRGISPDLIAVIGWSGIIGKEVLAIPKRGVLGHHPTLLPKHRGNAPIPWTLINGLARSGVTFFFMTEAIDAGDIAGQAEFEVTLEDDAASVYEKATRASARLLAEILPKIGSGKLVAKKQDAGRISRWGKRRPEDGIIDWNCMTIYLYNWVRGLSRPYPGASTFLSGREVLVW